MIMTDRRSDLFSNQEPLRVARREDKKSSSHKDISTCDKGENGFSELKAVLLSKGP